MRAENGKLKSISYTQPSEIDVLTSSDGTATIIFAENIETMIKPERKKKGRKTEEPVINNETTDETEPSVVFVFDSYSLIVPNREGLEAEVKANPEEWLQLAKQKEYDFLASKVRMKRNELLAESDSAFCIDRIVKDMKNISATAFTNKLKELSESGITTYRQALRDLPEQPGFPYNVTFPIKP